MCDEDLLLVLRWYCVDEEEFVIFEFKLLFNSFYLWDVVNGVKLMVNKYDSSMKNIDCGFV